MVRTFIGRVLLAVLLLIPASAAAHRPYFRGAAEPVALPGGEIGTIRLLYGDGILASDPVRPVVTDGNGGVRAVGLLGYAASYSCAARSCRVYVYSNTMLLPHVFDTDVSSMRASGAMKTEDANDLDAVLRLREPFFGFRHVPDIGVRVVGALTCLVHWWGSFLFLALVGMTIVPIWMLLRMTASRAERDRWGAAVLCVLLAASITLPLLGVVLIVLFASAYPLLLSLIPLGLPTAILLALFARRVLWAKA